MPELKKKVLVEISTTSNHHTHKTFPIFRRRVVGWVGGGETNKMDINVVSVVKLWLNMPQMK